MERLKTIKTAIKLGAIGASIVGMVEAGEINKKQNPELTVPQTGQEQVEQQPDRLIFYTRDKDFILRERRGELCEPLKQLSDGREVQLENLETRETLICVIPKSRGEVIEIIPAK